MFNWIRKFSVNDCGSDHKDTKLRSRLTASWNQPKRSEHILIEYFLVLKRKSAFEVSMLAMITMTDR